MPKSPAFPEPETQPYIGGILGTNILCIIVHIYFARPEAGEATRGYLHGGLLLDFIGQKGPSSKLHLVLLDTMIMLLQLTALAATIRRKAWVKEQKRNRSAPLDQSENARVSAGDQSNPQDHDAEERGEVRRPLLASDAPTSQFSNQEITPSASVSDREWELLDWYASGQSTVAELLVADTVRQQHNAYRAYRASSTSTNVGDRLRSSLRYPFRS
jgi:hypothetical protein